MPAPSPSPHSTTVASSSWKRYAFLLALLTIFLGMCKVLLSPNNSNHATLQPLSSSNNIEGASTAPPPLQVEQESESPSSSGAASPSPVGGGTGNGEAANGAEIVSPPPPSSSSSDLENVFHRYKSEILFRNLTRRYPNHLLDHYQSFDAAEIQYLSRQMGVNHWEYWEQLGLLNRMRSREYASAAARVLRLLDALRGQSSSSNRKRDSKSSPQAAAATAAHPLRRVPVEFEGLPFVQVVQCLEQHVVHPSFSPAAAQLLLFPFNVSSSSSTTTKNKEREETEQEEDPLMKGCAEWEAHYTVPAAVCKTVQQQFGLQRFLSLVKPSSSSTLPTKKMQQQRTPNTRLFSDEDAKVLWQVYVRDEVLSSIEEDRTCEETLPLDPTQPSSSIGTCQFGKAFLCVPPMLFNVSNVAWKTLPKPLPVIYQPANEEDRTQQQREEEEEEAARGTKKKEAALAQGAEWSHEAYLVALLSDLENVATLWHQQQQHNPPVAADKKQKQQTNTAGGGEGDLTSARPSPDSFYCYRPSLRAAVRFHRSNRWMFDPNGKPAIVESDVTDLRMKEQEEEDGRKRNATSDATKSSTAPPNDDVENAKSATGAPPPPPSSGGDPHAFWSMYDGVGKRQAKGANARIGKTTIHLGNICLPSQFGATGPPTGFDVPHGGLELQNLRDERWILIRHLQVHRRATSPRFLVHNRRLYLQPLIFATDNIGHVFFRQLSMAALQAGNGWSPEKDLLTAYLGLPSMMLSFGPHNMNRAFVHAVGSPWGGFFHTASQVGGGVDAVVATPFDVCFEKGFVGTGLAPMYHPKNVKLTPAARKQIAKLAGMQAYLRHRLATCAQTEPVTLPAANRDSTTNDEKTKKTVRVVVTMRSNRRLVNAVELVAAIQTNATLRQLAEEGETNRRGKDENVSSSSSSSLFHLEFVLVDFARGSVRQQFHAVRQADILIGPRGASHTWAFAMKPRSVVVEMSYPPSHMCGGVGLDLEASPVCEFQKVSIVNNVHHLVWQTRTMPGCTNFHRCDMFASPEEFAYLLDRSLCAFGKPLFARECALDGRRF